MCSNHRSFKCLSFIDLKLVFVAPCRQSLTMTGGRCFPSRFQALSSQNVCSVFGSRLSAPIFLPFTLGFVACEGACSGKRWRLFCLLLSIKGFNADSNFNKTVCQKYCRNRNFLREIYSFLNWTSHLLVSRNLFRLGILSVDGISGDLFDIMLLSGHVWFPSAPFYFKLK